MITVSECKKLRFILHPNVLLNLCAVAAMRVKSPHSPSEGPFQLVCRKKIAPGIFVISYQNNEKLEVAPLTRMTLGGRQSADARQSSTNLSEKAFFFSLKSYYA